VIPVVRTSTTLRPVVVAALALGAVGVTLAAGGCSPAPPPLSDRIAAFQKLPDWSGIWEPEVFVGEGIGQALSPEGLKAGAPLLTAKMPFNAEWQAKYDAAAKAQAAAVDANPDYPPAPPYPPCSPPPFLLGIASPALSQWRITPEEVTFIDTINFVRHIYTDGRSHPPADELWPTKMGDSIGRWEGDTLLVDTVAIKPRLVLFSFFTLDMSDQLHFRERIRMVGQDQIQNELTLEDPVAMTAPFTLTLKYARVKDATRMIDETECDQYTDRNPIVNGRFTAITKR
jgi:hypothetical protein